MLSLLFCLVMASGSVTYVSTECDAGWSYYAEDGSCLKFFIEMKCFTNARQTCVAEDGDLATIRDSAKDEFAFGLTMEGHPVFFGIWDEKQDGSWTDVHGNKLGYTHWNREEPNNLTGNEYCGTLIARPGDPDRGKWNDEECGYHLPFICEKETLYDAEEIDDNDSEEINYPDSLESDNDHPDPEEINYPDSLESDNDHPDPEEINYPDSLESDNDHPDPEEINYPDSLESDNDHPDPEENDYPDLPDPDE